MDVIEEIFTLAGSLICHQLPSRSLYAGDTVLPVCARDMGIYTGIFTSAFLLLLFRRLKAQKPPSIAVSIVMCLLMLPMILDGFLSYTGIIATNNTVRIFTGVLFGIPIPIFLVPAAQFTIHGTNHRPVLKNSAELLPVYLVGVSLCVWLLNGNMPYVAAGLIFLTGLLFLLSRVFYTIFARLGRFRPGALYAATGAATLGMLMAMYLLSSLVLQPIKNSLTGG